MSETVLGAITGALDRCLEYNPDTYAAPAVILWPDHERLWESFVPAVRGARAGVLTLGEYDPSNFTGPAIWIRCMLAGTLPEAAAIQGTTPIIYLPGISRSELRAIEGCPVELQPLAELQYRGAFWSQINARDWTPYAFLKTPSGGLGLDVAADARTIEALQIALPRLAETPVSRLRGRRLEASDFRELIRPESTRDLLRWLNDPQGSRERMSTPEWSTFRGICRDEYGFDPEAGDAQMVAAERLGLGQHRWGSAWRRYVDAPRLYPQIMERLRQAAPRKIDPSDLFARTESWPQFNEEEEKRLRSALLALSDFAQEAAAHQVLQLEEQHRPRRNWVWAALGLAPLATALGDLAHLANACSSDLTGGTTESLAESYVNEGWKADSSALRALASVEDVNDRAAVGAAIRAVYLPWLERMAERFQNRVQSAPLPSAGPSMDVTKPGTGECILFADGLRYDVGQLLLEELKARGVEVDSGWRWAALPTVTPTAKPAASPIAGEIKGAVGDAEFRPRAAITDKPLTVERFRSLLAASQIQVLQKEETGDPSGRAWAEYGSIDRLGHEEGAKLARRIPEEIRGLTLRINALLAAGWKQVRVVTDHGWLLLPGGLPKVELPGYLAETRWGRCAVLKATSTTDLPSFSWHWAPEVHVVAPRGIGCFVAGQEYSHGGLSLQECVVPVLTARTGTSTLVAAEVTEIQWKGLRCRVKVQTTGTGLSADLRIKPGDDTSSIASEPRPLNEQGSASLLVPNDDYEGAAVTLVIVDDRGTVIAKDLTTVGGM